MKSFDDFFMKKEYARVELLGDKLAEIEPLN
jgi:IS5 family transposase